MKQQINHNSLICSVIKIREILTCIHLEIYNAWIHIRYETKQYENKQHIGNKNNTLHLIHRTAFYKKKDFIMQV